MAGRCGSFFVRGMVYQTGQLKNGLPILQQGNMPELISF